jgi:hypothetical protein
MVERDCAAHYAGGCWLTISLRRATMVAAKGAKDPGLECPLQKEGSKDHKFERPFGPFQILRSKVYEVESVVE